ncbi:putative F-box protein At1g46984 [Papaver somniferum]|uniref:putative F-box protein At1g46984 n=1 Tax=Papaver somniferum TaxID=3469 RepID=UPI000E705757|nr:putative F-box protein At1g46984 [Papaver somniferum]XP_026394210.1 putative F-box protein At1g46984 [Papaver somniferum]XP_026394211.1 putative F-box protein At1g46984 [Papaver somniferum]
MMKKFVNFLPEEIIFDILTRLPTESVLECKLVCQTWRSLIDRPSFPQKHLTHLNHPCKSKLSYIYLNMWNHGNKHLYSFNYTDDWIRPKEKPIDNNLYYFEYDENWIQNEEKPIDRMTMFCLNPMFDSFIVLGSFNGVVCIHECRNDQPDGIACIFNPITQEYCFLPDKNHWCLYLSVGFGYLPSTDEYKIVSIYGCDLNFVLVEVYTVGSGNGWRFIGKFNFSLYSRFGEVGVFANGALYWRDRGKIVVFDLANEKFLENLSPPPMLLENDCDDKTVIGVSRGILFYAVNQTTEEGEELFDVWLLNKKQQGERLSLGWSKEFSLSQREPFTFTKYGYALYYDQGRLRYDPIDLASHRFMGFTVIYPQVFPHKHTLVSLEQLGEEDTHIRRSRESEAESDHSSDW